MFRLWIVAFSLLLPPTTAASNVLLSTGKQSDCKSDYYIQEYHVHEGGDRSTVPGHVIPENMRLSREISDLQRELIEEKKLRQKDIHYMLRIVDKLLKGREFIDENDDIGDDKQLDEEEEKATIESNDTTDLQQEWISATSKFRKDKNKKKRGDRKSDDDTMLRSDQGVKDTDEGPTSLFTSPGPRNDAKDKRHTYEEIMNTIDELQDEIKGLQVREAQIYKAYKKVNVAYRQSTVIFKQTMERQKRLSMYLTSEVMKLKSQCNDTYLLENKFACLVQSQQTGHHCLKLDHDYKHSKSKHIRDVSAQMLETGSASVNNSPEQVTADIAPETVTVVDENFPSIDDLNDLENDLEKVMLNEDNDLPLILKDNDDTRMTFQGKDDSIDSDLQNDLSVSEMTSVTSLSVGLLWDVLINAGKRVVTWANKREQQKLPSDCSNIDKRHGRWPQTQIVHVNGGGPIWVECHGDWMLMQQNMDTTSTQTWDYDSYENGIANANFFWLGNHYLAMMTSQHAYSLRIEMTLFNGSVIMEEYGHFQVADRENYHRVNFADVKESSFGEILGTTYSLNSYEFIVPVVPVNGPNNEKILRGWWYPIRVASPEMTAQDNTGDSRHENRDCYTHLNAEHPFLCDVTGKIVPVKATRMFIRRKIDLIK